MIYTNSKSTFPKKSLILSSFFSHFNKETCYKNKRNQGNFTESENLNISKTSIDENIQKEIENFKRISGEAFEKLTEVINKNRKSS